MRNILLVAGVLATAAGFPVAGRLSFDQSLESFFAPDNPDWGHPPTEAEVRATSTGWGPPNHDREGLFGPTTVRWYPTVQRFDGAGIADHLRSLSPYRRLDERTREALLEAIADTVQTRLGNRINRHYLSVLRTGQRVEHTQ